MRRVGIPAEAHPGAVFGSCDLDIRSALRIDEPKKYRFGIAGSPVWHLYGRIGRQDLDFGTNAATTVNELEFTTAQYGSDLLSSTCMRVNDLPQEQGQIGGCQGEQDALSAHNLTTAITPIGNRVQWMATGQPAFNSEQTGAKTLSRLRPPAELESC
jgi:hypothetical protein